MGIKIEDGKERLTILIINSVGIRLAAKSASLLYNYSCIYHSVLAVGWFEFDDDDERPTHGIDSKKQDCRLSS